MPAPIDPRQAILAALRAVNLEELNRPTPAAETRRAGYVRAVINVCTAIEQTAAPDELWEAGKTVPELTPADNIGEHLAATRRLFGLTA